MKVIARTDTGTIRSSYGSHLTAVDDDVAARAPIKRVIVRTTACSATNACLASSIDHAAIDGDMATVSIMPVAANGCRSTSGVDIDGSTVDGDITH